MSKNNTREILDVGAKNVDKTGFFCFMSKRKPFRGRHLSHVACCANGVAGTAPGERNGL
jgi:hypothetical protein